MKELHSLSDDFIPTRYSLLSRLQNWEDRESWQAFFDTYWRLIYSFALKSGLTEAEAEDVVQETVISVAKNIQKFKRDRSLGSFKGWLRNLTRWRVADHLRRRTNSEAMPVEIAEDGSYEFNLAEVPDSSESQSMWEDEWRTNLMKVALQNVKQMVREEHYQIFDLYVIKQWPAGKVAEMLRVSVGKIYLIKFRLESLVKKEVRRLENKELHTD